MGVVRIRYHVCLWDGCVSAAWEGLRDSAAWEDLVRTKAGGGVTRVLSTNTLVCSKVHKRAFVTEETARKSAHFREGSRTYQCEHCHFWHIARPSNMCSVAGKSMFGSEAEATSALERMWVSPKYNNVHGQMPKRVYLCDACGSWHLTSQDEGRTSA
jgi:hypothetical protein